MGKVYFTESTINPDDALLYLRPQDRYVGVWTEGREAFDLTYPCAEWVDNSRIQEIGRERRARLKALAELRTIG